MPERSKEQPQPQVPFEFTEQERLNDRLSHARFQALLQDNRTTIHEAALSSNTYGEFLFVTVARPKGEEQTHLTFYGLGYHEYRERWITETWGWYEATPSPRWQNQRLSADVATEIISLRQQEISGYVGQSTQSPRAKLYELLAYLTDEDGAISELEDLGEVADWLFGDEDSPE
jgi:hypothetical protein